MNNEERRLLAGRSTSDLLVLLLGLTLCSALMLAGITALVLLMARPDLDPTRILSAVAGAFNTLIGLLAGFLAGRHTPRKDEGS